MGDAGDEFGQPVIVFEASLSEDGRASLSDEGSFFAEVIDEDEAAEGG